jgi:polyisoprenoid-binding protein YceI
MDVSLADLQIDVPEARAVEGVDFAVQPSAAAIEGTRKNMLGASELDAAKFPDIHIRSVSLVGPPWGPDLTVRIALHGVEREFTLPIAIDYSDNRLTVTGGFEIHQTDFGITPLSILGGGLQVADQVKVRFHIVAEKP